MTKPAHALITLIATAFLTVFVIIPGIKDGVLAHGDFSSLRYFALVVTIGATILNLVFEFFDMRKYLKQRKSKMA